MDDIDRALAEAWHRASIGDDEARRRLQRYLGPTYQRPLRSWSLVLRAHDRRLPSGEVVNYEQFDVDGPDCAVSRITLTGELIQSLCGPVTIPWPGVTINAAAKRFGVNRSTIHNWAKKGRIVMDVYPKRGGKINRCSEKRIWTRSPLDPAGDVYAGPWGTIRQHLAQRVPKNFQQALLRTHRYLGRNVMAFMRCPKCDKWMKNLYWPQPIWTVGMASGPRWNRDLRHQGPDGIGIFDIEGGAVSEVHGRLCVSRMCGFHLRISGAAKSPVTWVSRRLLGPVRETNLRRRAGRG